MPKAATPEAAYTLAPDIRAWVQPTIILANVEPGQLRLPKRVFGHGIHGIRGTQLGDAVYGELSAGVSGDIQRPVV